MGARTAAWEGWDVPVQKAEVSGVPACSRVQAGLGALPVGSAGEQSALARQGHRVGAEQSSAVAARTRQFKF